jgi:hypothetical protein
VRVCTIGWNQIKSCPPRAPEPGTHAAGAGRASRPPVAGAVRRRTAARAGSRLAPVPHRRDRARGPSRQRGSGRRHTNPQLVTSVTSHAGGSARLAGRLFCASSGYSYHACTTGIRGFAECCILCRVLFVGHSAKKALPSAALGKVRLSAKSPFTEC